MSKKNTSGVGLSAESAVVISKTGMAESLSPDDTLASAPKPERGEAAALAPGVIVSGRYKLIARLGAGGMAEVWRASHVDLRVDIAIKFLDPTLARDPAAAPIVLGRFRFEAQVSAQLGARSRHVVAVHDAGTHRGIPYLAMELISGGDLEREVERRGPLPAETMADIVDQIADALRAAHELGIVHRDLKPSNILLASSADAVKQPLVKVADFGVAKVVGEGASFDRPRETAHGMLVGSPAFMSPEQAGGQSDIDGRSDIWSLGAVVYEALTGRPCFDGKSLTETLMAISTRRYVPLSDCAPHLGEAVDTWIGKCLSLRRDDRFASAPEAAVAFRTAVQRGKSGARAPSARGRRMRLWIGAIAVALATTAALFLSTLDRSPRDVSPAATQAATTESGAAIPAEPPATGVPTAVQSVRPIPPPPAVSGASLTPTSTPAVTGQGQSSGPAPRGPKALLPEKKIDPSEMH